ncbi:MAG: hypothetical protein QM602_00160 [Microbacterium sp.]
MRGRFVPAWAAAIAIAAALAGCTAQAPEPAEPAASTPSPTPSAPCIVGAWEAGAAQLQPLYDALPAQLEYPAATIQAEASVTIVFDADGGFALAQDVPVALEWEGHPAQIVLGGTMAGTYAADGDALALTATQNRLTSEPSDDALGSTLFAVATQETLDEWPVSASSFSCGARSLALEVSTEGHPVSVEFARIVP